MLLTSCQAGADNANSATFHWKHLALVDPSRVLFGSDYPWAGEAITSLTLLRLEGYQGIDQQARGAIERDNALSLFPRFTTEEPVSAGEAGQHTHEH